MDYDYSTQAQQQPMMTFRRLDVNSYMVTFLNTDKHTPDMISWILKERPEHTALVSFVETKQVGLVAEDNVMEMEIHLRRLCDVAELVAKAATQAAQSVGVLSFEFQKALNQ